MKKKHFEICEKLFAAQIGCPGLPPQFNKRNKVIFELETMGLVGKSTVILPGRFPVTIEGWELTPKGHLEYCAACVEKNESEKS